MMYCLSGKVGHTYFFRLTWGIPTQVIPKNILIDNEMNYFIETNDLQEYRFNQNFINYLKKKDENYIKLIFYRNIYDRICSLYKHKIDPRKYWSPNAALSSFNQLKHCGYDAEQYNKDKKGHSFYLFVKSLKCLRRYIAETHNQGLICGTPFFKYDYILDFNNIFKPLFNDLTLDVTWSTVEQTNEEQYECKFNDEIYQMINEIYIDDYKLIENNSNYYENLNQLNQTKQGREIIEHLISLKKRWIEDPKFKQDRLDMWKNDAENRKKRDEEIRKKQEENKKKKEYK